MGRTGFAIRLIDYFDRARPGSVACVSRNGLTSADVSGGQDARTELPSHLIGHRLRMRAEAAVVSPNCAAAFECVLEFCGGRCLGEGQLRNAAAENARARPARLRPTVLP